MLPSGYCVTRTIWLYYPLSVYTSASVSPYVSTTGHKKLALTGTLVASTEIQAGADTPARCHSVILIITSHVLWVSCSVF